MFADLCNLTSLWNWSKNQEKRVVWNPSCRPGSSTFGIIWCWKQKKTCWQAFSVLLLIHLSVTADWSLLSPVQGEDLEIQEISLKGKRMWWISVSSWKGPRKYAFHQDSPAQKNGQTEPCNLKYHNSMLLGAHLAEWVQSWPALTQCIFSLSYFWSLTSWKLRIQSFRYL